MAAGMLRDDLLSLPGVEHAYLDGDSMAPTGVRVHLAPGVDPEAVGDEVQRVLALHGLRSEVGVSAVEETDPAVGLAGDDRVVGRRDTAARSLSSIRVTEGRDGVVVEALDGDDGSSIRAARAEGPAFDQAVVAAVAELAGVESMPAVRSVDVREMDETAVVTVVIDEDGDRLVGSAVVSGGRAYAVGRAVWAALSSR